MATARANGNHRVKTEQRSQPMSEIRSQPSSQSRARSQSRSAVSIDPSSEPGPESANGTAGIARQTRDQLVSTIQQGQQVSIEAAQTWVEAFSALPIRRMPILPGFLAFPIKGAEAMTRFYFDVAADLLDAQREYTLSLLRVFASEEPV